MSETRVRSDPFLVSRETRWLLFESQSAVTRGLLPERGQSMLCPWLSRPIFAGLQMMIAAGRECGFTTARGYHMRGRRMSMQERESSYSRRRRALKQSSVDQVKSRDEARRHWRTVAISIVGNMNSEDLLRAARVCLLLDAIALTASVLSR